MKAIILDSGLGHRMGVLTSEHPKCMTEVSARETILSRQLRLLMEAGIRQVVITTGYYDDVLRGYCASLALPLEIEFVYNPLYDKTNYIYSIYCARGLVRSEDVVLMHGDLVFSPLALDRVLEREGSCMAVSSSAPLPEKDFKAVVGPDGRIGQVGIEFFGQGAVAAQPLYKLAREDWDLWLGRICEFCERGDGPSRNCYAEKALGEVSSLMNLHPEDLGDELCAEIDTPEDLARVKEDLFRCDNRTVYMGFSTDILHSGHIAILRKAARLGKVVAGVLTDEAVCTYKRFPLVPFAERKALLESLSWVDRVVEQRTLSYAEVIRTLRPDFVVHGDDWRTGFQRPVRDEVVSVLSETGGTLVEFPYSDSPAFNELERRSVEELSTPDSRRGRLRKLLSLKGLVTAMEAHSGLTGLLVEKTKVYQDGRTRQFDAMWVSSLCDSTAKGKPDIELVDLTSRLRTIDDIMEVTTKPIIFDADTGGLPEHFAYNVRTLERLGVSMVIIEDKTGLKKNSLFGTEAAQTQDSVEHFCGKIASGKAACKTRDFMICARIESLILEKGQEDALARARAYVAAGADAVMIHSRSKTPDEILSFARAFREEDPHTPLVVVPTTYCQVTEETLAKAGVNIVIYANQLTRSAFPAMQRTAETILRCHRALEAEPQCMGIGEILTLIPDKQ